MQRRSFLATLATLGTSGCLRLTQNQAPQPESPTTTPSTNHSYPNGISDDGVASFFHDTHARSLASETFSTSWTIINGQLGSIEYRRNYDVGETTARGSWSYDAGGDVAAFHTTSSGLWRERIAGETEYTYGESRDTYSIEKYALQEWLKPFISGGTWTEPTVVQSDSPAKWQLELVGATQDATVPGWHTGTVESFSGRMVVDDTGIIRSFDGEVTASGTANDQVEYRVQYEVDSIGEVSVEEPEWLAIAETRRPSVSVALTDDRRFLRLSLDSGNRLEPGTVVTVYDLEAGRNTLFYRLNAPIERGETAYFFKRANQGNTQVARGNRPSDVSPVPLDSSYKVWAERNHTEYFGAINIG